ncbi:CD164 sialomucin-like 2 protein isoform X2 [Numida meleagris]|uniref:CD164 sialomucin-like 2 protein isoform X2 n=1 Tax=Numida meleagris TaxID=8996 RepID=UPI000B3E3132|nr:CD164 sialomucin-like 2 protein isoform X2 [Numida meleagris]
MTPPCAGALRCAVLCAVLCAGLCAHGPIATRAECSELPTCQLCTAAPPAPNGTGCVWGGCGTPETWGCVRSEAATRDMCVLYNSSALCPALKSPTKEPPRSPSKEPTAHPPRSSTTGAPLTGSPEFQPPGFDTASFVGGAVLVLSVQAVLFFILKFIKSKDSAYQTLEDNQ